MNLPVLHRHPDCTSCILHEEAKSVGIPSRIWNGGATGKSKAVLLIGKHPGVDDDQSGECHSGDSGRHYVNHLYVAVPGLDQFADIYLTNAVRCRPPTDDFTLGPKHLGACKKWLEEDVRALKESYDEIVLFLCGSEPTKQLFRGVNFSNFQQGVRLEVGGIPVRCFATYHPFTLRPGFDPAKASAVEAHLELLKVYLRDGRLPASTVLEEPVYEGGPPPGSLVSLDIETYGAVEGLPSQRFFHPVKSLYWDKVPVEDLVLTAALAWEEGGEIKHRVYRMWEPVDQALLSDAIYHASAVLGQNLPFDVSFLRAFSPWFTRCLRAYQTTLIDLAVTNFLHCDQRPERSLKNLSPLLGTFNYSEEEVQLKKGQKYKDRNDPALHRYNAIDAIVTLKNYRILQERIAEKFGPDSAKLKPSSVQHFSDLLWTCIRMMENGANFNVDLLRRRLARRSHHLERVVLRSNAAGRTLVGKGSQKYKRDLAVRAAETLNLLENPRLKVSLKTGAISLDEENMQLFLEECPIGHPLRQELRAVRLHSSIQKTVGTYLAPMAGQIPTKAAPKKVQQVLNNALIEGRAYPTWYAVPSKSAESSSEAGGTQQARITCKGPALQTIPPVVEACMESRFEGGCLLFLDQAQIEMRVPVMFSNDPGLRAPIEQGINLHEQNASIMLGREVKKKTDHNGYATGKMGGFAIQFRAGAKTVQSQARKLYGLEIPLPTLEAAIVRLHASYSTHIAWQNKMLGLAIEQGYLEVPVIGVSRTFLGGPRTIERTYMPTICNILIQAVAALIVQSAQIAIDKWLHESGKRSVIFLNTYDEIGIDCPPEEVVEVRAKALDLMRSPPILPHLLAEGLHSVPLDSSVVERWREARVE